MFVAEGWNECDHRGLAYHEMIWRERCVLLILFLSVNTFHLHTQFPRQDCIQCDTHKRR